MALPCHAMSHERSTAANRREKKLPTLKRSQTKSFASINTKQINPWVVKFAKQNCLAPADRGTSGHARYRTVQLKPMGQIRDLFRQYCPLSADERAHLDEQALYVLDANVLLNVYRYSPQARQTFLDVLRHVNTRLWIPHQVALEFHRNRVAVIADQLATAESIRGVLDRKIKDLVAETEKAFKYPDHPFLNKEELLSRIAEIGSNALDVIPLGSDSYPSRFGARDPILEQLHQILDGTIGRPFTVDELKEFYAQADERYAAEVPPGFKDKEKRKPDRYGDFIIWMEILRRAKEVSLPIIFVTDDTKSDWMLTVSGRTVSILPELRHEFRSVTGSDIWIKESRYFIEETARQRGEKLDARLVTEISNNAAKRDAILGFAEKAASFARFLSPAAAVADAVRATLAVERIDLVEAILAKPLPTYEALAKAVADNPRFFETLPAAATASILAHDRTRTFGGYGLEMAAEGREAAAEAFNAGLAASSMQPRSRSGYPAVDVRTGGSEEESSPREHPKTNGVAETNSSAQPDVPGQERKNLPEHR